MKLSDPADIAAEFLKTPSWNPQVPAIVSCVLEGAIPKIRKSVVQSDLKLVWWARRKVVAKDQSGRILFAASMDKDDLEKSGYCITIDDH